MEKVEQAATSVRTATYRGTFAPGRPFELVVPADLTPVEALALVEKVTQLPRELAQRSHRIVVPRPS